MKKLAQNFTAILMAMVSINCWAEDDYMVPTFAPQKPMIPSAKPAIDGSNSCQNMSIVAVVNGEVITSAELKDRMMMLTSGDLSRIPEDHLEEAQKSVLNQVINERIQLQTIKMAGITVDDEDINKAIAHAEQHNNMNPGQLVRDLENSGVSRQTIRDHFAAKVGWYRFVSSYYRNLIDVSQSDLKEKDFPQAQRNPQYHLAEIVIDFENYNGPAQAKAIADQAYEQLKEGRPFAETAITLSSAPSAANGGDIGWVIEEQITPEALDALKSVKMGELTPPFLSGNAYKILYFRNLKQPDEKTETINARQLEIQFDETLSESEQEAEIQRLDDMFELMESCQEFDKVPEQIKHSDLHIYKDVSLPDLSKDLQTVLKDMPENKPSKGINTGKSVVYFMVCGRENKKAEQLNKDEEYDKIANSRLNAIASQKIHDLRRTASVDVRI